jgi:ribosome-binding factor A
MTSSVSSIKRAQKESLFFREISKLFSQTALDDNRLRDVSVNRVQLSPDKGSCTVFFYTAEGEEHFNQILPILVLYKPSLRKALASTIKSRYTPEIIFKFDKHFEKQQRIEHLIEQVKSETPESDDTQE